MKQIYIITATLILAFSAHADKGAKAAAAKLMASKGTLQLKFNAAPATDAPKDSVLVIFDRFDHTGAGVVYQIFYADKDNVVTIPAVSEGKYYVTIQCLGLHRDRIETVVKIKAQKNETLKISQDNAEVFSKGNVVIPVYHPALANLGIVKTK